MTLFVNKNSNKFEFYFLVTCSLLLPSHILFIYHAVKITQRIILSTESGILSTDFFEPMNSSI